MTPEQIAKLQEALGVRPTGVLDADTLGAMRAAQKQAGLRAHAGREVEADLARTGRARTPEGVRPVTSTSRVEGTAPMDAEVSLAEPGSHGTPEQVPDYYGGGSKEGFLRRRNLKAGLDAHAAAEAEADEKRAMMMRLNFLNALMNDQMNDQAGGS